MYTYINIKILYTQSRDGLEHVSPVSKRDIILGIYAKFQGGTGIQMWKFQKQPHSMLTRISLVSMSKRTLLRSLPKSSSHIVWGGMSLDPLKAELDSGVKKGPKTLEDLGRIRHLMLQFVLKSLDAPWKVARNVWNLFLVPMTLWRFFRYINKKKPEYQKVKTGYPTGYRHCTTVERWSERRVRMF